VTFCVPSNNSGNKCNTDSNSVQNILLYISLLLNLRLFSSTMRTSILFASVSSETFQIPLVHEMSLFQPASILTRYPVYRVLEICDLDRQDSIVYLGILLMKIN